MHDFITSTINKFHESTLLNENYFGDDVYPSVPGKQRVKFGALVMR